MPELNKVIAAEKSVKSEALKEGAALKNALQRPDPLKGISRTYQPFVDDVSEQVPGQSVPVQTKVESSIERYKQLVGNMVDLVATKDAGNQEASADVILDDGTVLLKAVPVTTLIFLEKNLVEDKEFVSAIPTLDPSEIWVYDANAGSYASQPKQTLRTKSVPARFEKSPATKEHPAQVEFYHEDVPVGTWTTIQFSGAMPADEKTAILDRIGILLKAVKYAREQANMTNVPQKKIAAPFYNYIFSGPNGNGHSNGNGGGGGNSGSGSGGQ